MQEREIEQDASADVIVEEGSLAPLTDNRRNNEDPQVHDQLRALPQDIQRSVAHRLGHVHEADGGLSEESVAGSNSTGAHIRNLANVIPPSRNVSVPRGRLAGSIETDPTAIARFHNDDDTLMYAAVPNSVDVAHSSAEQDSVAEETLDPVSTVTGQYTDTTEPELEVPLLTNRESTHEGAHYEVRQAKLCLGFAFCVMLLTVLMEAAFSSTKDHHIQPDRHPPSSRMQTVLRCASKLSNTQITELGSPRRWGVVKYFAEGGGRHFNVTNCGDDTSDFATLFGLRVLRDSTNMANPSGHQNKVLYSREVCERSMRVEPNWLQLRQWHL